MLAKRCGLLCNTTLAHCLTCELLNIDSLNTTWYVVLVMHCGFILTHVRPSPLAVIPNPPCFSSSSKCVSLQAAKASHFSVSPSSEISIGGAFSFDKAFSILFLSPSTSLCLHFPSLLHKFNRKRGFGSKILRINLQIIDPLPAPKQCFSTFLVFLFSL